MKTTLCTCLLFSMLHYLQIYANFHQKVWLYPITRVSTTFLACRTNPLRVWLSIWRHFFEWHLVQLKNLSCHGMKGFPWISRRISLINASNANASNNSMLVQPFWKVPCQLRPGPETKLQEYFNLKVVSLEISMLGLFHLKNKGGGGSRQKN